MKQKSIILLAVVILCSFILIGCFSTDTKDNKTEINVEMNKEINDAFRNKEILKIIENYKLPQGGTENNNQNTISYDNGYTFDKDTYQIVGPSKPTEEQYLAVIMGYIYEISTQQHWYNIKDTQNTEFILEKLSEITLDIEFKLEKLYEIKIYADNYEPIKDWINETISYLEESKELIVIDNERAGELYNMACKNMGSFKELREGYSESKIDE